MVRDEEGRKGPADRKPGAGPQKRKQKQAGQPPSIDPVGSLFGRSFNAAAGSLSQLTGREMLISFKDVKQFSSGDELVRHCVTKHDEAYFGSLIKVKSGLSANIVFLIADADGLGLYDLLNGQPVGTTKEAGDDVTVAMGEINNILSASFVNNIAALTGTEIHPSTPFNSHDMLEALMEGVVMQDDIAGQKVFCADTVIAEKNKKEFHARLLIIADREGLIRLIHPVKAA